MEKKNMNMLKIAPVFTKDGKEKLIEDFYYVIGSNIPAQTTLNNKVLNSIKDTYFNTTQKPLEPEYYSKLQTLFQRLTDLLGINKEIKDMDVRLKIFNPTGDPNKGLLQTEKIERYKVLSTLVTHFCGLLLHHFYWLNAPNQRYDDEDDLLNFIIRIGNMLMKEVNEMVSKQYNLVKIVESELKKTENVVNKRKSKQK